MGEKVRERSRALSISLLSVAFMLVFKLLDMLEHSGTILLELLILLFVTKLHHESDQLGLVLQQDTLNLLTLVWVHYEHLEDMERVVADGLLLGSQQVHHDLEVLGLGDVPGHDLVVVPVQQYVPQQAQGLALGDVAVAGEQRGVRPEEEVEVLLEERRHRLLVDHQEVSEGGESVGRDVELGKLDVGKDVCSSDWRVDRGLC
mmetsp:Transcript_11882/g.40952  ORF Transcript_11882/g.40952 Transcript_11882/m.40952 type:complete len:203 (-) Transcript_11882:746-1354(-)